MPFSIQLPLFQVETATSQKLYPSKLKAEQEYLKLVEENIPCEFWVEGILKKEHKPLCS
jgi:hypothetical protein